MCPHACRPLSRQRIGQMDAHVITYADSYFRHNEKMQDSPMARHKQLLATSTGHSRRAVGGSARWSGNGCRRR